MKKLLIITLLLILGSCTEQETGAEADYSSLADLRRDGGGVVELAFVPSEGFSYRDESGRYTGVTIELFRDFVQFVRVGHGLDLEYRLNPIERFSDFYHYVKEGDSGLFGVANVTITEARREELAFSPPYLSNIAVLITHGDVEEMDDKDLISARLADHTPLAFAGTLHEIRLRRIAEEYLQGREPEFAESNREIIEKVAERPGYVAYVDIYNYWRAAEEGSSLQRHRLFDESSEQFGVIMPFGSDWSDLMEEFFRSDGGYLQSQRYRELLENHLGDALAELLLAELSAGSENQ